MSALKVLNSRTEDNIPDMKYFLLTLLTVIGLQGVAQRMSIAGQEVDAGSMQIVVPLASTAIEIKAASELSRYLEMITGVLIPVVSEQTSMHPAGFIIGNSNLIPASENPSSASPPSADPDSYFIRTNGSHVLITGGSHKGVLYGVYEFLERYAGCRFWAPGAESVPKKGNLVIPMIDLKGEPAFASRETYYAGMDEQDFTDKMRSDRNAWKGGENWGMWVHTMFTLVPPDKYFGPHPEYYALMAGKRTKTQLCLTNPDVLKITIDELGRRMKERPDAKYWSVSQMDTYGSCECDACKAIDEREGSASGTMIEFVNKVAEAFPEKVISTLAYQYTRSAPKHMKPAANVNIMLCTIECDRARPISSDTGSGSFFRDIRDWSKIAGNILVWDYVIQFTNMIAPFPNLQVLQPNIQLFKKYGATAVFEQGCHGTYSENQELRQYLISKLLWNPELNVDSLTTQFLMGYYGAAGPFIGKYLADMERSLLASGKTLWIYAGPMQETDAFLGSDMVKDYNRLFEEAEKAVAGDTVLLSRVAKARLPLQYAILEIAQKNITGPDGFMELKNGKWTVMKEREVQLSEFVSLANLYGVKTIHEAGLTPNDYGKQVARFFASAYTEHLAKGKQYSLSIQPSPKYSAEGPGTLTDGKRGSANFHVLWQGFEENDVTAVIDLGKPTAINYVGAEFIQDITSWIFYPRAMKVSVSADGKRFREVADFDSLSYPDRLIIAETGKKIPPVKGRYVKFLIRNTGHCPEWHIGHGGRAWVFIDELIVK
jgi:hypothetical protein